MATRLLIFCAILFNINCATGQHKQGGVPDSCMPNPSTMADGDFEVLFNRYPGENTKATVLIVPPTGGANYLDRRYSEQICMAGFQVLLLRHWTDDDEEALDLGLHQRLYERSQRAINLLVDSVGDQPVGILGTSVGGLFAAMAMQMNDKVNTALTIASGANIAGIIANSDQDVLVEGKKKRMAREGFKSVEEYQRALDQAIVFEPLRLNFDRSKKNLGIILVDGDSTVPTRYQWELAELWEPSLLIELRPSFLMRSVYGFHTAGIIETWLHHDDKVVGFFKDYLN